MFDKLGFYFRHSLNDLKAGGRRSLFAIFCIAAGVAAVVALQMVGGMITDTVALNTQERNRGDVRITAPTPQDQLPEDDLQAGLESGVLERYATGFGYEEFNVTPGGVDRIQQTLEEEYPGQVDAVTYRQPVVAASKTSVRAAGKGTQEAGPELYAVKPGEYPLYGEVQTLDEKPLSAALGGPRDVVLNEDLAKKLKVGPGDEVNFGGADEAFTVRGVVPDNTEADSANTGYGYLTAEAASLFDREPGASQVYIKLAEDAPVGEVAATVGEEYPYLGQTSTEETTSSSESTSQQLAPVVGVIGFVSLLVGGIGIVNTMQVIVRRRTLEVAVLKTVGLQGRQVTLLFLVEALS